MDIMSKVKKKDIENARIDRERTKNPPDFEAGMDDFGDDLFSKDDDEGFSLGGGGLGDSTFGSSPFGSSPFGSSSFGIGYSPFGQQQQQKNDPEEKIWELLVKITKGYFTFFKELVQSFREIDDEVKLNWGRVLSITSIVTGIISLVMLLFGVEGVMSVLIGSLLSLGSGIFVFSITYDKTQKNGGLPQTSLNNEVQSFDNEFSDFGNDEDMLFDEDYETEEDDLFFEDSVENDDILSDDDFNISFDETPTIVEDKRMSENEILDSLQDNMGMVTRQYLFDKIYSYLISVTPDFDKTRIISEDSDEFDAWDVIVKNSASVFKPKGNDIEMPYLISAKEKLFYYQLEIARVNWLKNIDAYVSEIANICRFDEETGKVNDSIYGVGYAVGDKIYIKIMKDTKKMVTIKDAYNKLKDNILNSDVYMPIVIGLDSEGGLIWRDFKSIDAILVAGMPRSGKTWLVLSILAQMSFYLKPSELNFYIFDPKDTTSDFYQIEIPHIRYFGSSDNDVLSMLRHILKVEGARRAKIIGEAGFVNIWDYKKANPDVDLPLIYVVIDEVITYAERMEKEQKDEFQALILELVSRLPALGIRIFMIPHVIKDQVLKKSITDLIQCRISVRGDAQHIEKTVGTNKFKHRLLNQGDMAVRFFNEEPLFARSVVLSPSNEENKNIFNFLLKFWGKIEPSSLEGSLHEQRKNKDKKKGLNIEWGSGSENKNSSTSKKLSEDDILDLLSHLDND